MMRLNREYVEILEHRKTPIETTVLFSKHIDRKSTILLNGFRQNKVHVISESYTNILEPTRILHRRLIGISTEAPYRRKPIGIPHKRPTETPHRRKRTGIPHREPNRKSSNDELIVLIEQYEENEKDKGNDKI